MEASTQDTGCRRQYSLLKVRERPCWGPMWPDGPAGREEFRTRERERERALGFKTILNQDNLVGGEKPGWFPEPTGQGPVGGVWAVLVSQLG
jgi:hypothetical protein